MWLLTMALACGPTPFCDEGTARPPGGETCAPYTAGAPVTGDVVPFANGLSWQWQITGRVDTSHDVDVYDVDLFDLDAELEQRLHADGRRVLCYFSAGSYEPWRPDADRFPDEAIGPALDGWPDERWVDPNHPEIRAILEDRLELAVQKGCDGVEPDNITVYDVRTPFGINATEQLAFDRFVADAAHARDLAVAMKNDVEHVRQLVDWFDLAVNEECAFYEECGTLAPFVAADKAVLHTEYVDDFADASDLAPDVCGVEPGLSTIIKTWDLGPELLACE